MSRDQAAAGLVAFQERSNGASSTFPVECMTGATGIGSTPCTLQIDCQTCDENDPLKTSGFCSAPVSMRQRCSVAGAAPAASAAVRRANVLPAPSGCRAGAHTCAASVRTRQFKRACRKPPSRRRKLSMQGSLPMQCASHCHSCKGDEGIPPPCTADASNADLALDAGQLSRRVGDCREKGASR